MTQGLGQGGYQKLADEIGEVLMSAAAAAEKMQDEARAETARMRTEAEAEVRLACAEGRRILDDARMEADMVKAEAEWQAAEAVAQARRVAAEHLATIESRLAELARAEELTIGRVAGAGQALAEVLARLQAGPSILAAAATALTPNDALPTAPTGPEAKIYFVEFPPLPPAGLRDGAGGSTPSAEVVLDAPEPAPVATGAASDEASEWAPPSDLPTWWTQGSARS